MKKRIPSSNRLVKVVNASDSTTVATYAYDGLYRRITRSDGATTTHEYYNERWKPIEEREGASSDPVRQWVWGQRPGHRDELVLRDRDTNGDGTLEERLYCLMDYFDPTAVIDTGGTVLERYDFTAFGIRRIMAADFSARSSSSYAWRFGFKGQLRDTETGYYNYGFRYYVPRLGRWIKRDPIEENGGVNVYAFVGNNSMRRSDSFGLICDDECECGEVKIDDVQSQLANALRAENIFNPDENANMYDKALDVMDSIDTSKIGKMKIKKPAAQYMEFQEAAAEAMVKAIPKVMEMYSENETEVVIWYRVKGRCCKEECCLFIMERCAWEDADSGWKKADESPGALGLGYAPSQAWRALPELVANEVKNLCDSNK